MHGINAPLESPRDNTIIFWHYNICMLCIVDNFRNEAKCLSSSSLATVDVFVIVNTERHWVCSVCTFVFAENLRPKVTHFNLDRTPVVWAFETRMHWGAAGAPAQALSLTRHFLGLRRKVRYYVFVLYFYLRFDTI